MDKRTRKPAVIGTVDSDSEIEIDLSATVNAHDGMTRISHKRFTSESVWKPTASGMPLSTLDSSMFKVGSSTLVEAPRGPLVAQTAVEKPKRKQVLIIIIINHFAP
jgi:hypothetical protein